MKKKNVQRADAGDSLFFQSELQSMMADFYVAYPQMMHPIAIPTNSDADPGATTVSYKMYDVLGVAKIIANYADDLPRADVAGRQYFLQVHTLGVAAGWDYFEVQAGRLANKPIDSAKLSAAREIILRLADKLAFYGDSTVGIVGLTNIANMPNTVVPTFSSQTTWADKLALNTDAGKNAVLNDLSLPFTRMAALTKVIEVPDTVALSPTSFAQLAQTPRTDSSDTTLLDFFLKAHPGVEVIVVPQLENSGTGGARQMIVYKRDPAKVKLEIPEDIVVHDSEKRNLEWVVPLTMRFAGVVCRYPLSLDSSYGM